VRRTGRKAGQSIRGGNPEGCGRRRSGWKGRRPETEPEMRPGNRESNRAARRSGAVVVAGRSVTTATVNNQGPSDSYSEGPWTLSPGAFGRRGAPRTHNSRALDFVARRLRRRGPLGLILRGALDFVSPRCRERAAFVRRASDSENLAATRRQAWPSTSTSTAGPRRPMDQFTPEQGAEQMALWQAWAGRTGKALLDFGSPFGPGTSVKDDGTAGTPPGQTGYTIVRGRQPGRGEVAPRRAPVPLRGQGPVRGRRLRAGSPCDGSGRTGG
jgi:hypothetical protein